MIVFWANSMSDMLATVRIKGKKRLKILIEEYETRKAYKIFKYSLLSERSRYLRKRSINGGFRKTNKL
jgi:hypothetical protein